MAVLYHCPRHPPASPSMDCTTLFSKADLPIILTDVAPSSANPPPLVNAELFLAVHEVRFSKDSPGETSTRVAPPPWPAAVLDTNESDDNVHVVVAGKDAKWRPPPDAWRKSATFVMSAAPASTKFDSKDVFVNASESRTPKSASPPPRERSKPLAVLC